MKIFKTKEEKAISDEKHRLDSVSKTASDILLLVADHPTSMTTVTIHERLNYQGVIEITVERKVSRGQIREKVSLVECSTAEMITALSKERSLYPSMPSMSAPNIEQNEYGDPTTVIEIGWTLDKEEQTKRFEAFKADVLNATLLSVGDKE